ncbi:MAG: DUF2207 domain-containing protein [Bacilli bacterium]|nr:DUF2207 domain-containing protein [Bacilli bacterium]
MKKKYLFLLLIMFLLLPSIVNAKVSYPAGYITDYKKDIVIKKNNKHEITETFTVYYVRDNEKITRKYLLDATMMENLGRKLQIYNVKVDNNFDTYEKDGYLFVNINDKAKAGDKKIYTIKYTYNFGKDTEKELDYLYLPIVRCDEFEVDNISFSITAPKDFDYDWVSIKIGGLAKHQENIKYSTDGNILIGSYDGELEYGESIYITGELPNNYFKRAGYKLTLFNYLDLIVYSIPIIFLLIVVYLWKKHGDDEEIVVQKNPYPPLSISSLSASRLVGNELNQDDVSAILIDLANKGYIKIKEKANHAYNEYFIIKVKEYDGNNIYEQLFFKELFKESVKKKDFNEVSTASLRNKFYHVLNVIRSSINSPENLDDIFDKSYKINEKIILSFIWISTILLNLYIGYRINTSVGIFSLIFNGIIIFILSFSFSSGNKKYGPISFIEYFICLVVYFVFFLFLWFGMIGSNYESDLFIMNNLFLFIGHLMGNFCICTMIFFLGIIPKRTKYGNLIVGEIIGFTEFIKKASKEEIEKVVKDNPNYFSEMFSYAYALGYGNDFVNMFSDIQIREPNWYFSNKEYITPQKILLDFGEIIKDLSYEKYEREED